MHVRPHRLARLGLPAVAVLALALSGCGDPAPAAPAPSSAPASATPSGAIPQTAASGGTDGLTVRYLGDDGTVQTVPVEDFSR